MRWTVVLVAETEQGQRVEQPLLSLVRGRVIVGLVAGHAARALISQLVFHLLGRRLEMVSDRFVVGRGIHRQDLAQQVGDHSGLVWPTSHAACRTALNS